MSNATGQQKIVGFSKVRRVNIYNKKQNILRNTIISENKSSNDDGETVPLKIIRGKKYKFSIFRSQEKLAEINISQEREEVSRTVMENYKDETEAFREYQPQQTPQELEQENIALRAENTLLRQEVANFHARINEQDKQLTKIQNFIEKQHKEAISLLEFIQGEQTWRVVLPKVIDKLSEPFGGVYISDEQIKSAPSPSETSSVSLEAPNPKEAHKALTLPDPVHDRGSYELWANRINRNETPLEFMSRVWGRYIADGVMYQIDLKGQQRTATNPNPRRAIDKTLFDAVWKQCKEEGKNLNDYLPNKSIQIDREFDSYGIQGIAEGKRSGAAYQKLHRSRQGSR